MLQYKTKFILIGCVICMAWTTAGSGPQEKSVRVAPGFTLKNVDGRMIQLKPFMGRIIVLEWMHPDCTFVKSNYSNDTKDSIRNLRKKYADENIVWLSINSNKDATEENNKQWAEKFNLEYVLLDADGTVGRLYGATKNHEIFIIDKKGNIVYQGGVDNAPLGILLDTKEGYINYLDLALKQLTRNQPVKISRSYPFCCLIKYASPTVVVDGQQP